MKVLLLNYYWPPCGGSAVQRWVNILNEFGKQGVDCSVVTIKEEVATFPVIDPSLNKKVDPQIKVYRTNSAELFNVYKKYIGQGQVPSNGMLNEPNPNLLKKVARFVRGNFFLPDPRKGWNKYAYEQAKKIIIDQKIDWVITAGPPHSTHLIGKQLRQELNIKWQMDMHDYWSGAWFLQPFYRTAIASFFDKKLEQSCLQQADLITTHTRFLANKLQEQQSLSGKKIMQHSMGYNEELFAHINSESQAFFSIAYSGVISEQYAPQVLLEALSNFINQVPDAPLQIRFAGMNSPIIEQLIGDYKLSKYYKHYGYLSHTDAVHFIKQATVLFLINPQHAEEKYIVPGKIFEYLAAHKPIISISPHGSENEQIINEYKAGKNFERSAVHELANYIGTLYQQWQLKKEISLPDNMDKLQHQYGRKHESQRLLSYLQLN